MSPTPEKRAANRRKNLERSLLKLKQQSKAEDNEKIARLENAIKEKDEVIAALTTEELQGMDVMDIDKDDSGDASNTAAENEDKKDSSEPDGENGGKEDNPAPNDDNGEKKKKKNVTIEADRPMRSVEQDGKRNEHRGDLFDSSDGSDSDSDADDSSNSDTDASSDSEYGRPLFSRPGPKSTKDAETVGWTGGRSTLFINRYGAKNAARYRLEKFAQPPEYEDDPPMLQMVTNPKNRLGDERLDNGKYKYTKRHILGIYGVAWNTLGAGGHRYNDVEEINPDLIEKWTKVRTYVLIAWDVGGGETKKCWEPRSTLRARWGKSEADIAIYNAAVEGEERYAAVKTGKRRAASRSPSVGLAQRDVNKQRAKSLGSSRSSTSRSPSPARKSRSSKSSKQKPGAISESDLAELRKKFLGNYLELLDARDFKDLDRDEKRACLAAWDEEKEDWLARNV